ncbi:hypothetical protein HNR46_002499 [Haloferula luteola]|uniref:Uncharacterized protein n=1 Tax=Haloferula luteola TaxID=595692 RepID=A0A840V5F2_9BACT|nr:hypothetical protein [Haloferula luteola]MBB5352256.1 hypothetical protein [Haloferula luteola]
MSKPIEYSLLLPGSKGWEVWKKNAEGRYERASGDDGPLLAGELENIPSGELAMLFPVRELQAMPFRAASTEDELFEDLAVMHAERLGIRPDPMAGQLSDTFVVEREVDSTVLVQVVIQNPRDGELPARTPKEFDLSPRAYAVSGNEVCLWKELGRWVFALYKGGKLIYCQATSASGDEPNEAVLREIRLAVSQLNIQGLKVMPDVCRVWPPAAELGVAGALEGIFSQTIVERRPDPDFPEPPSKLLPADVRAARRERQKRNQILAGVAVLGIAYLGFVGWKGFELWQSVSKRNQLAQEAAAVAGESGVFQEHQSRWDELGPLVDDTHSLLEVMLEIKQAIPPNSGLRLKTADLNLAEDSFRLIGSAPQSSPINVFSLNLKRNPTLRSWLEWSTEPPANKNGSWDFSFSAIPTAE